ncbi:MAG: hypothetical protein QM741_09360 [Rudaea sp.]|uniref:hypothetical protein n=1 Tax=Rudaea sp. TaxID=2136325 RepID=UPI0039E4ECED
MNIKSVCFTAIATCLGAFAPQHVLAGSLTGITLECVVQPPASSSFGRHCHAVNASGSGYTIAAVVFTPPAGDVVTYAWTLPNDFDYVITSGCTSASYTCTLFTYAQTDVMSSIEVTVTDVTTSEVASGLITRFLIPATCGNGFC